MFENLTKITQDILETQAELKKKVQLAAQEQLKPALREVIIQLRESVPNLTRIEWDQYTPYFNDGDECVFSLGEVYFTIGELTDEEYNESLYAEERRNTFSVYSEWDDWHDNRLARGEIYQPYPLIRSGELTIEGYGILHNLSIQLRASEDLLKACFGDHARVRINVQTGDVDSEEYTEHD